LSKGQLKENKIEEFYKPKKEHKMKTLLKSVRSINEEIDKAATLTTAKNIY
jgi:hypothetical protein